MTAAFGKEMSWVQVQNSMIATAFNSLGKWTCKCSAKSPPGSAPDSMHISFTYRYGSQVARAEQMKAPQLYSVICHLCVNRVWRHEEQDGAIKCLMLGKLLTTCGESDLEAPLQIQHGEFTKFLRTYCALLWKLKGLFYKLRYQKFQ